MKGIVFTQFLDLVEDKFGYDMVDSILEKSDLPSGGIYTAVGTYHHSEMVQLLTHLSAATGISVSDLLKLYGRHLFGILAKGYGHFLTNIHSSFDLLENLEKYIHVEVKKLYPDAELPTFETTRIDEHTLEMIYHSERKLGDFGVGLMEACFEHFGEKATVQGTNLKADGSVIRYIIIKQ